MQATDYDKISITAKLAAYARQVSDIPFANDVAVFVKAEDAILEIASKMESGDDFSSADVSKAQTRMLAPLFEARYKGIARLIEQSGIKQVLELASGFSLRGLAMTQDSKLTYVETDLAGISEEKKPLIAALKAKTGLSTEGNYCAATANALDMGELEAAANGLDHSQPLVVVTEGLISYLCTADQAILADNVHHLIRKFSGGAWITPDFTTKQIAGGTASEEGKRFRLAIDRCTEHPLYESSFESEVAIDEFVEKHGFTSVCSSLADLVPDLASPAQLGLGCEVLERLKPRMRIWLLSPK